MLELLIVLILALVLLAAVFLAPKPRGYQRPKLDRELISGRWENIQTSAGAGALGLKSALNEADKLLDYALKAHGYPGETMALRLKSAQGRFSDYQSIWRAHKLRNGLAHDVDFDLVASQVRQALTDLERGLKDLGALR